MSWVAAAVVGGSVIGGIASSKAAGKAADAQQATAQQASATELEMFNQNREDLAPWREAGSKTLEQIMSGLKPGGEFATSSYKPFTMADFYSDPGYQFQMSEGQKALERSAAAKGLLGSGGTLKDTMRFSQGLADQTYGDAYKRYVNDFDMRNNDTTQRFNRLATVAGLGQTSAGQTASLGANTASNVAGNIVGAGNAEAAQRVATGNAISGVAGSLGNYMLMNKFMGK